MDDKRRLRTRKLLYDALVDLNREKGFHAVRVVDITEHAGVNRATFYRHYRDKFEMIESIFSEGAREAIQNIRSSAHGEDISPRDLIHGYELLFRHFVEHHSLYATLLGRSGSPWFEAWLRTYWTRTADSWTHLTRDEAHRPPVPPELISVAAVHTLVGTVTWWLEDGFRCSPRALARWYVRLLSGGLPCALELDMTVRRSV